MNNKKRFEVKMNLSTVTVFLIVMGISLIILANILLNVFTEEFLSKYYATRPILDIANTIGNTLFSAGIVSILVEISTIKGIVLDALNKVLQGNIPLDSYSNDILYKLNKNIAAKRSSVDIEKIGDSIYSMESNLIGLLDGLYYSYYNMSCEITPDEKLGVFKKMFTLDYEIVNDYEKDNQVCYTVQLYNINDNMTDLEKKKAFNIKKFIINNTDLSNEVEEYKEVIPITKKHSPYQYFVRFKRKLQHCKKHKIHLEFEYDIPIEDMSQIFRLTFPCKSMSHEIYVNNENNSKWTVHGTAFVSFYCEENNDFGFHVTQKHDTNLQISFNNWCIPGAGYVVYLAKN